MRQLLRFTLSKSTVWVLPVVVFYSCLEASDGSSSTAVKEVDDYKNTGERIPVETAQSWREFASKQPVGLKRSFKLSKETLKAVVGSSDNLTGVSFRFGIDESGELHILMTRISSFRTGMAFEDHQVVMDAVSGSSVEKEEAQAWIDRYSNTYPDKVCYHFFGVNALVEINAMPYLKSLELVPAINNTDLSEQLLLFVRSESSETTGRFGYDTLVVYDKSNPCPPFCEFE